MKCMSPQCWPISTLLNASSKLSIGTILMTFSSTSAKKRQLKFLPPPSPPPPIRSSTQSSPSSNLLTQLSSVASRQSVEKEVQGPPLTSSLTTTMVIPAGSRPVVGEGHPAQQKVVVHYCGWFQLEKVKGRGLQVLGSQKIHCFLKIPKKYKGFKFGFLNVLFYSQISCKLTPFHNFIV